MNEEKQEDKKENTKEQTTESHSFENDLKRCIKKTEGLKDDKKRDDFLSCMRPKKEENKEEKA